MSLTPFNPSGSLFRPPSRTSVQGQVKNNAFNMGTGLFQQKSNFDVSPLDKDFASSLQSHYADLEPDADPGFRDALAAAVVARQRKLMARMAGIEEPRDNRRPPTNEQPLITGRVGGNSANQVIRN